MQKIIDIRSQLEDLCIFWQKEKIASTVVEAIFFDIMLVFSDF